MKQVAKEIISTITYEVAVIKNEFNKKNLLWYPLAIGVGSFVYFTLYFEGCFILICSALITLLVAIKLTTDSIRNLLIACLLGGLSSFIKIATMNHSVLEEEISYALLSGEIIKVENIRHGVNFLLKSDTGLIKCRCLLKDIDEGILLPGNVIKCAAKLYPFADNNLGYNFKRHALFANLFANGVLLAKPEIISYSRGGLGLFFEKIRAIINHKIALHFSEDTKGIAASLVTGDRGAISSELKQSYASSGIAHILSISGLHITMISGLVFYLVRLLLSLIPIIALRFEIKKIAAIVAVLVAMAYVVIAGLSLPALRSVLMLTIMTVAILKDRTIFSLRNVAIAAIIILLCIPEAIYSPGFYMSFFVVASLISYYEGRGVKNQYFQEIVISSVISSCAVTPLTWYYFNQVVLNSITANLLSIPLSGSVIMPFLFAFVLGIDWVSYVAVFGIKVMNLVAVLMSSVEFFYFRLSTPYFYIIAAIMFAFMLLIIHKVRVICATIIVYCMIAHCFMPKPTIFITKDLSVIGVKDDGKLYVNNAQRFRSLTNLWVQTAGVSQKIVMSKEADSSMKTKNHTIKILGNKIIMDGVIILDSVAVPMKKHLVINK